MAASSSGYSEVVKSTPSTYVLQVSLARYDRSISYNLSEVEKATLAFKRVGIPKGKMPLSMMLNLEELICMYQVMFRRVF